MRTSFFSVICMLLLTASFARAVGHQACRFVESMLPYSIQVERVGSTVDGVPAEFTAAIYENLIDELTKSGKFQQVLRDGDNRADSTGNLIKLKTTVQKFQEGSETKTRGHHGQRRHEDGCSHASDRFRWKGAGRQRCGRGRALHRHQPAATLNLANSMVKQLDAGLSASDSQEVRIDFCFFAGGAVLAPLCLSRN